MELKGYFSILSGLVFLYAFYPYIKAIVRRETSPRKATWFVWYNDLKCISENI